MKTIVGDLVGGRIILDETPILSLVVEEPKAYFDLCSLAYTGFRGRKEFISFLENDKEIEPEFVENLFWPDLNSKKNLNALYKRLKQFGSEELEGKLKAIREAMKSVVLTMSMDFDGELICNGDIKSEDLFKMFDLRFAEDDLDGFSRLVRYISVSHELSKTSVFSLRGLHQCFSDEELDQLGKEASYKRINLVSFESTVPQKTGEFERVVIVDKDLCAIK